MQVLKLPFYGLRQGGAPHLRLRQSPFQSDHVHGKAVEGHHVQGKAVSHVG